tara:strand:- start:827 stop:1591 length:765 start_codon:yes stop_codon:yes gene_type:complete
METKISNNCSTNKIPFQLNAIVKIVNLDSKLGLDLNGLFGKIIKSPENGRCGVRIGNKKLNLKIENLIECSNVKSEAVINLNNLIKRIDEQMMLIIKYIISEKIIGHFQFITYKNDLETMENVMCIFEGLVFGTLTKPNLNEDDEYGKKIKHLGREWLLLYNTNKKLTWKVTMKFCSVQNCQTCVELISKYLLKRNSYQSKLDNLLLNHENKVYNKIYNNIQKFNKMVVNGNTKEEMNKVLKNILEDYNGLDLS